MSYMNTWNKLSQPPKKALKTIGAGRLKGMTDINPQWRIKALTEAFGQCGIGWYYEIVKTWTEQGAKGGIMAFVQIHLFTKQNDQWSAPIVGIGGNALIAEETAGLRTNDEAYKMALTDAISVATKQLGVGSAIYEGRWDGSKYRDESPKTSLPPPQESAKTIAQDAWEKLTDEERTFLTGIAVEIKDYLDDVHSGAIDNASLDSAWQLFYDNNLDNDEKTALWSRLDSKERSTLKKYNDEKRKAA